MGMEPVSRLARLRAAAETFFDVQEVDSGKIATSSRLRRFAHFAQFVAKSFQRNQCPVRASALAYTTLLALVPVLAFAVSVSTSMLQKQGEEPIDRLINQFVDYAAPALDLEEVGTEGREKVVTQITGFISRINTETIGVASVLVLLFVAISLLRTIEAAMNHIWGVAHGRPWFKSVVYYWAAMTLGPIFLASAITLTTSPHLQSTQVMLNRIPFLGTLILYALPFLILTVGFAAFYAFMPNTRVKFSAALVGGAVGGCLWQINNMLNVIYVSRAETYTTVYGSLAILPLFLVGLYISWLIVLLGAQVAYAFQNREAYIQEKQAERVNERGREFLALRLMTSIAQNFQQGERPLSAVELSNRLNITSRLVCNVLATLVRAGLLVEVSGTDIGYSPGRPLRRITAYDVLCALRAGQGIEPTTREDDTRMAVRAEFEKITEAEREAGSATLDQLVRGESDGARAATV